MEAKTPEPHEINWDTFIEFAEHLCLPADRLQISEFKLHSKLGYLSQIFFNQNNEESLYADVTFGNALTFVKDIIYMFTDIPSSDNLADFGIKSFVDTKFESDINRITLAEWLQFCDTNLRHADMPIQRFFRHILLKEIDTPEIPLFTPNSDIMNKELEALLYLSNSKLNHVNTNMNLVYSNTKHGGKIEDMVSAMNNYEGDVMWLFKHIASEDDKRAGKPPIAIFGAYTTVVPQTTGADTSDKDCYLFSLMPTFKCLHPIKFIHKVCNNYLVGDSQFGKKGLGFCRDQKTKEFRIWIDEKYSTGSKLNDSDDAFGKEKLLDGVSSLRITAIECWGFIHPALNVDLSKAYNKEQEMDRSFGAKSLIKGGTPIGLGNAAMKQPISVANVNTYGGLQGGSMQPGPQMGGSFQPGPQMGGQTQYPMNGTQGPQAGVQSYVSNQGPNRMVQSQYVNR